MTLPTTLKIGGILYTVREEKERAMYSGDLQGDIRYAEGDIRIGSWLAEDVKRQVLWHEVVHGLLVEGDIKEAFGEDGPVKEERIQHLSKILQRFVQENDLSWEVRNERYR